MRAYLITSGLIFVLLVVAHVWRLVVEGPHMVRDPAFVISTALAMALSIWAFRLLRTSVRS